MNMHGRMHERLQKHLQVLTEDIGPRPIGTAANLQAEAYIAAEFQRLGFAVRQQSFSCPNWCWQNGHLRIARETTREEFLFTPNPFTIGCDVTGPLLPISTVEELKTADLMGKIALLYGDIASERLMPRAFKLFQPERHVTILRLLEEKQPIAVLLVSASLGRHAALPLLNDWLFPIPSATVSAAVGLRLMAAGAPLHLHMETATAPSQSANVIARFEGPHVVPGDSRRIVVAAHFDTHFWSSGATDNASGVAVLLALAENGANGDADPPLACTVEFIAFNGEEYAALGDQAYLDSDPDFENMIAVINVDGVGQALGTTTLTAMGCSAALEADLRAVKSAYPAVQWVEPWYESNHTTFLMKGVPAIALSSRGVQGLADSPDDTIAWVSSMRVAESMSVLGTIIEKIQHATPTWSRRKSESQC